MTTKRGTKISWAQQTWNPVTGCTRISEGCRHCYAETLSLRFGWSKLPWTKQNEEANVKLHPKRLQDPLKWKEPQRVFVNSMADLFHELVPDDFIRQVWDVMVATPQHTYMILTKRAERIASWPGPWPANIWQGVSVENARALDRVDHLRRCGAMTRFLSCEPLLEELRTLDLTGIHWVIAGGESGPGYRPMDHAWARNIRDRCLGAQGAIADELAAYGADTRGRLWPPIMTAGDVEAYRRWLEALEVRTDHPMAVITIPDEDTAHPEDVARAMEIIHAYQEGATVLPAGWTLDFNAPARARTAFFFKQSAAPRTEMGTALEEEDGSAWEWRQFPGMLEPPIMVRPPRATEQLTLGGA